MFRIFLSFLLLVGSSLHALADVQVTAGIEATNNPPNSPVEGTITITHNLNKSVDKNSFRMEGMPLTTDFIKDVRISPTGPVVISFYHFQIPGKDPGLYMLPEISVKVEGETYKSIATTYEVSGGAPSAIPQVAARTSATRGALKLEALVDNPQPFYPGQHALFTYRFYFQGDIALTAEALPLLDAKGFEKVGDKVINDSQEGGWSVQTINQEVKAVSPGQFVFPQSTAEGYSYQENPITKKRTYLEKLQGTADAITINVSALPANPPSTFTGAIGSYTFQTSLLSPPNVSVEDKVTLAIDISSNDSMLQNVNLPSLNQPGIKGLFRMSSLPPSGTVQGDTKRFFVDLYPLSTSTTQIPSLAFTYFDPIASKYVTLQSNPITIGVTTRKEGQKTEVQPALPAMPQPTQMPPEKQPTTIGPTTSPRVEMTAPEEIEIPGNPEKGFNNYWFGTWWGLYLIPLAVILLLLQVYFINYLQKKRAIIPIKNSEVLWNEALSNSSDPERFYPLLTKAFLVRLKENGTISSAEITPESLPSDGTAGKVKNFLSDIQEKRFTGTPLEISSVIKEASVLFQELKNERSL